MQSPVLALVTRALRLETRSIYGHLLRLVLLVAIGLTLVAVARAASYYAAPGLWLLQSMGFAGLALVAVTSVTLFAPCIAEEREAMTLGLLRLTALDPIALLAGIFFGRLYGTVVLMTVGLPPLLLCITLGGVSVNAIATMGVLLAGSLLVSSATAFLISVLCRRTAIACVFTGMILFAGAVVLPMGTMWLAYRFAINSGTLPPTSWAVDLIQTYHPLFVMASLSGVHWNWATFAIYLGLALLAAVVLFAISWLVFRLRPLDGEAPSKSRAMGRARRARRFGWGALAVKDFRHFAGGLRGIVVRIVAYLGIWGVLTPVFEAPGVVSLREWQESALGFACAFGVLELTILAGRFLQAEDREGTLPLLMMLPRRRFAIAWAKLLGGLWVAVAPLILVGFGVFGYLSRDLYRYGSRSEFEWFVAMMVGFACFLHWVTFYSLWIRWGATVLAIATVWVMVAVIDVTAVNEARSFMVLGSMVTVALHAGILLRLGKLAAR